MKNYLTNSKQGFTLIELSIVLVIIGVIVGGILTGQDLIKAAEQRATLAQIEKYNTATNTFRSKYLGLPGDLSITSAASFGLFSTMNGSSGQGDGNGLIGEPAGQELSYESVVFWRHLSDAALIDGNYAQTGATAGTIAASGQINALSNGQNINLLFPAAKLQRGNYIIPEACDAVNYFFMAGLNGIQILLGIQQNASTNNLTALEAYNMDKKIDDGLPGTGIVWAINANALGIFNEVSPPCTAGLAGMVSNVAACVNGTNYAVNPGTTQACSMRFRFN